MKKEIWKPIKGYDKYYKISNKGRVKQLKRTVNYSDGKKTRIIPEKIVKQFYTNSGYLFVGLANPVTKKRDIKDVHRLVAETFITNPNKYPIVNHKNDIKTDNVDSNLEWTTYSENKKHAIVNGLHKDNIKGLLKNNEKHRVPMSCYKGNKLLYIGTCSTDIAMWFVKSGIIKGSKLSSIARAVRKFSLSNKPYYGITIIRNKKYISNKEVNTKIAIINDKQIINICNNSRECAEYLILQGIIKHATINTASRRIRAIMNTNKQYYKYNFKQI